MSLCYLSHVPCGALTDIGHTKAETVCAAKRVFALQVVETWFAQITVSAHYIHLRRSEQVTSETRENETQEVKGTSEATGDISDSE